MSRIKFAVYNLGSSLALNLVSVGLTLVSMPLIIGSLGEAEFGRFRILAEWLGFFSILTAALGAFVAQDQARLPAEARGAIRVDGYASLARLLTQLGSVAAVLLVFLSPTLLGAADAGLSPSIRRATAIGSLPLLLLPFLSLQGAIEARNRGFLMNSALFVQRCALTGLSVLFAVLGAGLEGQFLAILGAQLLLCALLLQGSSVSLRALYLPPAEAPRPTLSGLLPFAKIDLAGRLSLSIDAIVLARFVGPAEITVFFLWSRLPSFATQQLMSFGNSIWAGFAELAAEGGDTRAAFHRLLNAVCVISSGAAGAVFALNELFLELWFRRAFEIPASGLLVFAANTYLISVISFLGWILTVLRGEREFAKLSWRSALLNLVTSFAATWRFGLIGPALGSLIAYGCYKLIALLRLLDGKIGIERGKLFRALLLPPLTAACCFQYSAIAALPLYGFVAWLFLIDRAERVWILSKLNELVGGKT